MQITLPDQLTQEARRVDGLFAAVDRMTAADEPPRMPAAEVAAGSHVASRKCATRP